jgi:hypothetical protein
VQAGQEIKFIFNLCERWNGHAGLLADASIAMNAFSSSDSRFRAHADLRPIPPRGGWQVFTAKKVDALNRFQKEREALNRPAGLGGWAVYKDRPFAYTKLLLNSDRGVAP